MSYTDSQSIIQSGGGLQNFSPGAVESDGLIDGIDRNAVEEEVKAQIDYDCLMSYEDDSVVKMVEEIKELDGGRSMRRTDCNIRGETCVRENGESCLQKDNL